MSAFPIVVPERAPTTVHVAKANAADVAERARTTETTTHASFPSSRPGRGPAELEDEREHEGEDEAFTRKRGAFAKDLAYMMYGFGDAKEPDPDSIELMEDMLVDYLTNVAHRAMEVAERRGRMQTEDLLYVIRNDRKKFARVDELLEMNAKLKDARRNFELHDPQAVLAQQRAEEEARRAKADADKTKK